MKKIISYLPLFGCLILFLIVGLVVADEKVYIGVTLDDFERSPENYMDKYVFFQCVFVDIGDSLVILPDELKKITFKRITGEKIQFQTLISKKYLFSVEGYKEGDKAIVFGRVYKNQDIYFLLINYIVKIDLPQKKVDAKSIKTDSTQIRVDKAIKHTDKWDLMLDEIEILKDYKVKTYLTFINLVDEPYFISIINDKNTYILDNLGNKRKSLEVKIGKDSSTDVYVSAEMFPKSKLKAEILYEDIDPSASSIKIKILSNMARIYSDEIKIK